MSGRTPVHGFAPRVPTAGARSADIAAGQAVDVVVDDDQVVVCRVGGSACTLVRKLAASDPARHDGEAMAAGDCIGRSGH